MLESELFTSVMRMLLITLVPVTAIVVASSLFGTFLTGLLSVRDEVLVYALRVLGAGIAIVLLWPGISGVILEESQRVFSYGF